MKRVFIKATTLVFSLVVMLTMFTACGSRKDAAMDAVIDTAVKAALDATAVPASVTIVDTDGRHVTIENAEGKNLRQLLDQANITLGKNDFLTLDTNQTLSGNITVQVCRNCTVTVLIAAEDTANNICYAVTLTGGTVADAIAATRVELGDFAANYALHETLVDGMEIIVYTSDVPVIKPEETGSENTGNVDNGSDSDDAPPQSTEPVPTQPAPTEPERIVIGVEVYEDCDGSGHGVKVITYSDGTQEEVYF